MAAITWKGAVKPQRIKGLKSGEGFVAVLWEKTVVISCYFSPNKPIRCYKGFLDSMTKVIRKYSNRSIMVLIDFNARSHYWDIVINTRGKIVIEWATEVGLGLVNNGRLSTCSHSRSLSAVT